MAFFGLFNYQEALPIVFHVFSKTADNMVQHLTDCHSDVHGHIFHVANMCERPSGELILDLTYSQAWTFGSPPFGDLIASRGIMRFTLDLERGKASSERLTSQDAGPVEFVCVNPNFVGNPDYRFFYGLGFDGVDDKARLVKFDLQNQHATPLAARGLDGSLLWASEPQFVPEPGAGEEGGVLLCPVTDEAAGVSFLLVVDPATMKEVARVSAPMVVNNGLHNRFVPDGTASPYPIIF